MVDPDRVRRLLSAIERWRDLLAVRFRALSGLRNLLVHLYDDIDDERIAREVRTGLGDLNRFSMAVARLLHADEADTP